MLAWVTGNPFLTPSTLPFAFPDFDAIREEHFAPAFAAGMAEQRAEVDTITADPSPATFENTIVALERSGATLRRVSAVFFTLAGSCSTEGIRAIEAEVAPQLAAHADAILLDPALFARIEALFAARDDLGLDAESAAPAGAPPPRRRAGRAPASAPTSSSGCARSTPSCPRCRPTSARSCSPRPTTPPCYVTDPAQLDGLSPDAVSAAARAAASRGLDGHLLTLVLPTGQPVLASLADRDLRERVHTASISRGARGNEHDTREIVRRIERAARRAGPRCSGTRTTRRGWSRPAPPAPSRRSTRCSREAGPRRRGQRARRGRRPRRPPRGTPSSPGTAPSTPSGSAASASTSTPTALRPYFELERVLHDGVFHAAGRLYGLRVRRAARPAALPPRRAGLRRLRRATGRSGLFVADLYARDTKRGGAWMNSVRHPVAAARTAGRWCSTRSTSPSPPTASRRC